MPGYVLAKLKMTDDVYHLVKNTPKVTGFLGSNNKPQAISEKEAARYFGGVEEAKSAPKREIHVFRMPDDNPERELHTSVDIPLKPRGDNQLWVSVYTEDGFQAWSSPIFVFR